MNVSDAPAPANAEQRSGSPSAVARSALCDWSSYARFLGIGIGGLALDLWSKHWAFHSMGQLGHRVLVPHVLEFQTMMNKGALFGIGQGRTTLFLVASVFALVLVLWMFVQSSPKRWALQIALGGILAGALGNMYDRMTVQLVETATARGRLCYALVEQNDRGYVLEVYPPSEGQRRRIVSEEPPLAGYVRDFIKIPTTAPDWSWLPASIRGHELWPWVFNVADMLLVGGVGILAIYFWRDRKPHEAEAAEGEKPEPIDPQPAAQ